MFLQHYSYMTKYQINWWYTYFNYILFFFNTIHVCRNIKQAEELQGEVTEYSLGRKFPRKSNYLVKRECSSSDARTPRPRKISRKRVYACLTGAYPQVRSALRHSLTLQSVSSAMRMNLILKSIANPLFWMYTTKPYLQELSHTSKNCPATLKKCINCTKKNLPDAHSAMAS